jgi:hypothetical protein
MPKAPLPPAMPKEKSLQPNVTSIGAALQAATASSSAGVTDPPLPLRHTRVLYNNGSMRAPLATTAAVTNQKDGLQHTYYYKINYDAILYWLTNQSGNDGANPFPAQLRAGGVLYYASIPTHIDTTTWPLPTTNQAQKDARFWKEFIDEVLGVRQDSAGSYSVRTPYTGYGDDFTWGGSNPIDSIWYYDAASGNQFNNNTDNPKRPKVHFWFGPMALLDFIGNYNADYDGAHNPIKGRLWGPGTGHEAPTWECKVGVQSAMRDIQNNHPNDSISVISFSQPSTTSGGYGFYNAVNAPLGKNYNYLVNSLWFAPKNLGANGLGQGSEISPYDPEINTVPRANGSTCYAYPLMLAYNQFNSDPNQRSYVTSVTTSPLYGQAGGLGRNGAEKVIIFETDGMVVSTAYSTFGKYFQNKGAYSSYFAIRQPNEWPDYVTADPKCTQDAYDVAQAICNSTTNATPGYSTPRKPAKIYTIAFGSLFDPSNGSAYKTQALGVLQNLQTIGGVQSSNTTPLPSNQIIVGTPAQRISNMQSAFQSIMQGGVQISLVQ